MAQTEGQTEKEWEEGLPTISLGAWLLVEHMFLFRRCATMGIFFEKKAIQEVMPKHHLMWHRKQQGPLQGLQRFNCMSSEAFL